MRRFLLQFKMWPLAAINAVAVSLHIAERLGEEKLAPARLLPHRLDRALPKDRELHLAHRALHAEQKPVVERREQRGGAVALGYDARRLLLALQRSPPIWCDMTDSDVEIFRSANLYLELHDDDAVAKARGMVRTMKEHGDNDAADRWLQIIVAIETVRQRMERGLSQ